MITSPRRLLVLIPIIVFAFACRFTDQAIQEAEDSISTAMFGPTQAEVIVTRVTSVTTQVVPINTVIVSTSSVSSDGNGNILDPQDPPLESWNQIPIMPQASAGAESEGIYAYKANVSFEELKYFYNTKLPDLGWSNIFSVPPANAGTSILIYQKNGQTLTVTATPQNGYQLILLTLT